jgi:hypothetical protein
LPFNSFAQSGNNIYFLQILFFHWVSIFLLMAERKIIISDWFSRFSFFCSVTEKYFPRLHWVYSSYFSGVFFLLCLPKNHKSFSLMCIYSYSHKKRNMSFAKHFSAQYFRLTKTNKGRDFDIFLQIKVQILQISMIFGQ